MLDSDSYVRYLTTDKEGALREIAERVSAGEVIRDAESASQSQDSLYRLQRRARDWDSEVEGFLRAIFMPQSEVAHDFSKQQDDLRVALSADLSSGDQFLEMGDRVARDVQSYIGHKVSYLRGLVNNLRYAPTPPEWDSAESQEEYDDERVSVPVLGAETYRPSLGGGDFSDLLSGARSKSAFAALDSDAVDASKDLLNVSRDADALGYMLAAKNLSFPLSVAIFGKWGSGKTFFLRRIRTQIATLCEIASGVERPSELYLHSRIAQVEFNAWHYAEGNLWASLTAHLFSNLHVARESDTETAARSAEIVRSIESIEQEGREAHSAFSRLEQQKSEAKAELEELQRKRRGEEEALKRPSAIAILRRVSLTDDERNDLKGALQTAGLSLPIETGREALSAIKEARGRLAGSHARSLLARGGWTFWLAFAAVLSVPFLSYVIAQWDLTGVGNLLVSLCPAVAVVTAVVRRGSALVSSAAGRLERAEEEIMQELEEKTAEVDREIAQKAAEINQTDIEIERAKACYLELAGELAYLEDSLKQVTPSRLLGDFLSEKSESDEYSRLLGLPASVSRDMSRLSSLIEENNQAGEDGIGINRVVVYIDDLDRCEAKRVIEVLHAVHLLSSFRNIVVVLAVDVAWLASALRSHYVELAREGEARGDVALQYLEKIFQIPIWTEAMSSETKSDYVRRLIREGRREVVESSQRELRPRPTKGGNPKPTRENLAVEDSLHVEPVSTRTHDDLFDPLELEFSEDEVQLISEAASLLDDSPRAIKRFLNVLRLLKMVLGSDAVTDRARAVQHAQILLLALCSAEYYRPVVEQLLGEKAIDYDDSVIRLRQLLTQLDDSPATRNLVAWLDRHPSWTKVSWDEISDVAPWILRHTFYGPFALVNRPRW
ncbi:P-loop NTPase fold protein [Actinomycetospora atypica]|uniref:P-loop NTPase fold protein n=1 Tax=Actinomycetospora atypica TaxID=1290095 RepID=A0ABV9YPY4_9PSEU